MNIHIIKWNALKVFAIIASCFLVISCGRNHVIKDSVRKGRKLNRFGGVLKVNEISEIKTLFPHNLTSPGEIRVASQIYEGLVSLDQKTLEIVPALAEKWEVNENATIFKFYLRKGVYFHENKCFGKEKTREVTANDFKYCLTKLCEANRGNRNFWLFTEKVKGANKHYLESESGKSNKREINGIRVIDRFTLEIELESPYADFPMLLTSPGTWVFPKEGYESGMEGEMSIGTGPFICKVNSPSEIIILEKNRNYWKKDKKGNKLPYLDAIKITFVKDKEREILAFRQGFIDLVHQIPVNKIENTLGDLDYAKKGKNRPFLIQNAAGTSHVLIRFNRRKKFFQNYNFRKAFNLAINREYLTNYTLLGEGVPAKMGVIPPALKNYPAEKVKGFEYNPFMARKLLNAAFSEMGKSFPDKINLLVPSESASPFRKVALELKNMIESNLDLKVDILLVNDNKEVSSTENDHHMWLEELSANYPNPEVFLRNFYSKNKGRKGNESTCFNRQFGFENPEFDQLYELGLKEVDAESRMKLFCMADQVIIDDAAMIPLYYTENIRILSKSIREFPINGMEVRDFSSIFFYRNI